MVNVLVNDKFPFSVAQAYLNQKRLDHESKELHVNVTNFAKQTAQWLQLVENFSQVLKVSYTNGSVFFAQ